MTVTATFDYNWQGAGTRLPSGHRIFEAGRHPGDDGVAWGIADDSGATPDQCDSGTLWLDPTQCLKIGEAMCIIPCVTDTGIKAAVGCGGATVMFLARMFNWAIHDEQTSSYYNERQPSKLDLSDGRRVSLVGTALDFDRVQQACRRHLDRFEQQVRGGADANAPFTIHIPERDRT
jgi:hypothetical protein